MPSHRECRELPWSARQLCAMVADVERYPEFLPWCVAARIRQRQGLAFQADLQVGFRLLRETFTSQVDITPERRIDVVHIAGPFRHMSNRWLFLPRGDGDGGGCEVDFAIDFAFRSPLLRRVAEPLFHQAARRMVGAFQARARALYGLPEGAGPQRENAA